MIVAYDKTGKKPRFVDLPQKPRECRLNVSQKSLRCFAIVISALAQKQGIVGILSLRVATVREYFGVCGKKRDALNTNAINN